MNIRELRRKAPDWTWIAERCGLGWVYVGERDARRVRVYAVAMLCGPTDDDFATQWRVDAGNGAGSCSFAAWWMKQRAEKRP